MNSKQRKTLEAVFADPASASIAWADIEGLLKAIGCKLTEGAGSRVKFEKNGVVAGFHRPHPRKEAKRYAVLLAREFLIKLEIQP
jgi:HicA toxin of bacterial toxin-antitoxin,